MNKYKKKINDLETQAFKTGGILQITIDLIQEAAMAINGEEEVTIGVLGSLCYKAGRVIEIMDEKLYPADANRLRALSKYLSKWQKALEKEQRWLNPEGMHKFETSNDLTLYLPYESRNPRLIDGGIEHGEIQLMSPINPTFKYCIGLDDLNRLLHKADHHIASVNFPKKCKCGNNCEK
jgi:hypothetical protein